MELGSEGGRLRSPKNETNEYLRKLCSGITLQSNKDGFFNSFLKTVQDKQPDNFQNEFGKLDNDIQRIRMTWYLPEVNSLKIDKFFTGKNIEISDARRLEGNAAFQSKNDRKALKLYTQSVMRAGSAAGNPTSDGLSLALANRSAILFHLNEYSLCIQDVTLALEAFLPDKLHYKVLNRRADCHKQLGLHKEALQDYQLAVKSLNLSTLDPKKQIEWENDVLQKMDKLKEYEICSNNNMNKRIEVNEDPLFEGQSKILLQASAAIQVKYSKDTGRYAVANRDIPAGVTLVREKPISSVLMTEKIGLHCSHCFARLLAPIPCDNCCFVAFCSPSCKKTAIDTYHQWECYFSGLLTASGMSINCYLALRIITERSLNYFLEIREHLQTPKDIPSEAHPHRCDDYVNLYNLVALEDMRTSKDFFHRSVMAVFLLKVLISSGYLNSSDHSELSNDAAYMGSLLLRHLQVIQFNAHELSGVSYIGGNSFKQCKSVYLGLAIYPTISFFNHSCFPAVGRYFNGKELTIMSLRPIMKGQAVEENYGPIFTKDNLEERSMKLLSRYWFSCRCEACVGNWPTYSSLDAERFKIKCPQCLERLVTRSKKSNRHFNVQENCIKCRCSVTVESRKCMIERAKTAYKAAVIAMEKGDQSRAITLFLDYVNGVLPYILLPQREFHLSLDSLRLLIATKGTNYSILEEQK